MNDKFSILIMGIPVTYSLIILGIRIFKRSAQSPFYVLAFRKTLLLRSVCVRRMFWSNNSNARCIKADSRCLSAVRKTLYFSLFLSSLDLIFRPPLPRRTAVALLESAGEMELIGVAAHHGYVPDGVGGGFHQLCGLTQPQAD